MAVKKVCFQETQILSDIFKKTQSGNCDVFIKTQCGNNDVFRKTCSKRKTTFETI